MFGVIFNLPSASDSGRCGLTTMVMSCACDILIDFSLRKAEFMA